MVLQYSVLGSCCVSCVFSATTASCKLCTWCFESIGMWDDARMSHWLGYFPFAQHLLSPHPNPNSTNDSSSNPNDTSIYSSNRIQGGQGVGGVDGDWSKRVWVVTILQYQPKIVTVHQRDTSMAPTSYTIWMETYNMKFTQKSMVQVQVSICWPPFKTGIRHYTKYH